MAKVLPFVCRTSIHSAAMQDTFIRELVKDCLKGNVDVMESGIRELMENYLRLTICIPYNLIELQYTI